MTISVKAPTLSTCNGLSRLEFPVEGFGVDVLSYSFSGTESEFVSQSLDTALIALVLPAMLLGQNIHLQGNVSPLLHFHVQDYIIPLLATAFPLAKTISVTADAFLPSSSTGERAVITGMSNGIDSLHVCATHLNANTPQEMRPTHLLFHDIGSHGREQSSVKSQLATERLKKSQASADALNLPLIVVRSNIGEFFPEEYEQSHTLRSASVALALSGKVSSFLYASGVSYGKLEIAGARGTAHFDPILLPLIKTEAMECFSIGASSTRVEKTAIVSEYEFSYSRLNVCVSTPENCSKCGKCLRTIFMLDLLGQADKYAAVFDLQIYKKLKSNYIAHVLAARSDGTFTKELKLLMKASGFRPSTGELILSLVLRPIRYLADKNKMRIVRSLYKRTAGFSVDH